MGRIGRIFKWAKKFIHKNIFFKKRATLLCFMSLHQSLFITLKMKPFAYSLYRVPQFDQTLHSVEMFSFCSTCYYSSQCPQQTPEMCIKNEGRNYREGRIKNPQNCKFCSHNKSKCLIVSPVLFVSQANKSSLLLELCVCHTNTNSQNI